MFLWTTEKLRYIQFCQNKRIRTTNECSFPQKLSLLVKSKERTEKPDRHKSHLNILSIATRVTFIHQSLPLTNSSMFLMHTHFVIAHANLNLILNMNLIQLIFFLQLPRTSYNAMIVLIKNCNL